MQSASSPSDTRGSAEFVGPAPGQIDALSRYVLVDGIRTHYLEAGDGPTVVLLHDGSYGASGQLCWYDNVSALAERYRIIAPDWLGFGDTDKLHDFGGGRARRLRHLTRLLETLDVHSAAFVGNSMGATMLLQVAASREEPWPIAALVSASGGGFIPMNEARRKSVDYDCTYEGMRSIISVFVHDQRLLDDDRLVGARYRSAIRPGAWEAIAAARFKSPLVPQRSTDFGQPDTIVYEQIRVPTLLIAGAEDQLREPGYATGMATRIPDCELVTFERCGHMPQIEQPQRFNETVLAFLARAFPS
jgi:pimeloyl-ACP methyl ester carboxylesterase